MELAAVALFTSYKDTKGYSWVNNLHQLLFLLFQVFITVVISD